MFRKTDQLWLFAIPIYLLILVFRHEAGHAVSAVWYEGAEVISFAVLPSISEQGDFVRPHIKVRGSVSRVTAFAPYIFDAISFLIFFPVCIYATTLPRWIWLNLIIFGLFLPFFNSLSNYGVGLLRPSSDVGSLLSHWPDILVHLYFIVTIASYSYGSYYLLQKRKSIDTKKVT